MRNRLIKRRQPRGAVMQEGAGKDLASSAEHTGIKLPAMQRSKVALGIASMCFASSLVAAPVGPEVVHGSASFIRQGSHLEINNSHGTIINWQDFSIASQESVNFLQTHASSAILNRVISNIPTDILGELTSNGRVFVINPNGLVIGKDATIDTAGFVASTLNLTDNDFIAGRMKFVGDSGEIENHGYIAVAPGGEVVLIAPSVENHGVIEAPDGSIVLAAGREVILHSMQGGGLSYKVSAPGDRALNIGQLVAVNGSVKVLADQIFQQGEISANRVSRAADGTIVLEADTTLAVSGKLSAQGQNTKGGDIHLLGKQVDLTGTNINASGEGGGEILIGGDYQGKGSVTNAENTNTDAATIIRADGGIHGDGGRVIVWSDNTTNSFAKITARGGHSSGDGGFVETSGKKTLDFGQPADVSASNGAAGTWLLDPEDIIIDEDHADSISESLSGGSNVEVRTSDEGDGEGNIEVNAPITKSDGNEAVSLTLDAHNRVDVNAPITTTAGPLNLTIKTGRGVVAASPNEQTPSPELAESSAPDDSEQPADALADDPAVAVEAGGTDSSDPGESAETGENNDEATGEVADADTGTDSQASPAEVAAEVPGDEALADSEVDAGESAATQAEAAAELSEDTNHPAENQQPGTELLAEVDEGSGAVVESATHENAVGVAETANAEAIAESTEAAEITESPETAELAAVEEIPEVEEIADAERTLDVVTEISAEAVTAETILEQEAATELDSFIDQSARQVVIAADIFTGGGEILIDAGSSGDTIISANITSSDQLGETAGDITIEGQHIAIVDDSTIDASAEQAGTILIGGGQEGQNPNVDNSEVVILAAGTSVSADGGTHGDGGTVIVFSEQSSIISGNLSARGGSQGGDGGFVETSGLATLRVDNAPDIGASNGAGGEWLIDPYDVTINNFGCCGAEQYRFITPVPPPPTGPSPWLATPTQAGAYITTSVLYSALLSGDVTISTTSGSGFGDISGSGFGDINFVGDLVFNNIGVAPAGSLTLNAYRNINFSGTIDTGYVFSGSYLNHNLDIIFNAGVGNTAITPEGSIVLTSPTSGIATNSLVSFNARADVQINNGYVFSRSGMVEANATFGEITVGTGTAITGQGIQFFASQGITNSGVIEAFYAPGSPSDITLHAGYNQAAGSSGYDIINYGQFFGYGAVSLHATRDIRDAQLPGGLAPFIRNYAGTTIQLTAARNIDLHGNLGSKYGVTLNAGGDISFSQLSGGVGVPMVYSELGSITLNAAGSLVSAANITANASSITLTSGAGGARKSSGTDVVVSGSLFALSGVTINSTRDIRLETSGAITTMGTPISLSANRDINIYGNMTTTSGGFIDIAANTGGVYSGNLYSGTSFNSGDGYGVVNIRNFGLTQFISSPDGTMTIQGAGLTLESSGCATPGCQAGIHLAASEINLGTSASEISGDIVVSSIALPGQNGGGNTISAGYGLTIEAGADLALVNRSGTEDVSLVSGSFSDIHVRNNLSLVGNAGSSPYSSSTFTSSIITFGDLSLDVGGTLSLDSGEISLQSYYGEAGAVNNVDTITVNNFYASNGLIAFNRDQNPANIGSYAPGELVFTTQGPDSRISGVDNPVGPDDYSLALRSVTWVQNGNLNWDSGSIELTQADIDFSPIDMEIANDSMITNNGEFAINSETGDFSFTNGAGIGTFYNNGTVIKDAGTGITMFAVNLDNTGSFQAYAGTISLGIGGLEQGAGETVLRNGNISVDMGSSGLNFTGGALLGGFNSSYPDGGILTGDVTLQDSVVSPGFSPGFSPGTLTVDGNFDASAGGNTFNFEVDVSSGLYDQLIITGDAQITGNNSVNAVQTGYFPASIAISSSYSAITVDGSGTIDSLPTVHAIDDPSVVPGEFTDGATFFNLVYTRAAPPPPVVLETATEPPPATVVTVTPPPPPPVIEPEPEVIVVIIDETPMALPPDIVAIILSLTEDERKAYLESERVRKVLKAVNQCIGNA